MREVKNVHLACCQYLPEETRERDIDRTRELLLTASDADTIEAIHTVLAFMSEEAAGSAG